MELNIQLLQHTHYLLENCLTVSQQDVRKAGVCQNYMAQLIQEIERERLAQSSQKPKVGRKPRATKKANGEKKAS